MYIYIYIYIYVYTCILYTHEFASGSATLHASWAARRSSST